MKPILKSFICITFFLLCLGNLFALDKRARLAILDFVNNAPEDLKKSEIMYFTDQVRTIIRKNLNSEILDIMTRENTMIMLEENNVTLEECIDKSQCEVDVGRFVGADYILTGEVIKIGQNLKIILKLHNIKTADLLDSQTGGVLKIEEAEALYENLAEKICKTLLNDILSKTAEVLEEKVGYLSLEGDSRDVLLYLNDDYKNPAGMFNPEKGKDKLKIGTGLHKIIFEKNGFKPCIFENIEIEKGKEEKLKCEFIKIAEKVTPSPSVLFLKSIPTGARIFFIDSDVENDTGNSTPFQFKNLKAGEYQILLKKNYYKPKLIKIILKAGEISQPPETILESNFATINIKSNPPGATVIFDQKDLGITPMNIPMIEPGMHKLTLSLKNYYTEEATFNLKADDLIDKEFGLRPSYGKLVISVEPEDAEVYLDDSELGEGDVEKDFLPSGIHNIRIERELYKPQHEEVLIEDGKTLIKNFVLEANFGTLLIKSDMAIKSVLLNDEEYGGETKIECPPLLYNLEIIPKDSRYKGYKETLNLETGDIKTVTAIFEKKLGNLMVLSEPPEAEVYLNNDFKGKSPIKLENLLTGKYKIMVQKENYLSSVTVATIKEGENTTIEPVLTMKNLVLEEYNKTSDRFFLYGLGGISGVAATTILSLFAKNAISDKKIAQSNYMNAATVEETQYYLNKYNSNKNWTYFFIGSAVTTGMLSATSFVFSYIYYNLMEESSEKLRKGRNYDIQKDE